LATKLQVECKNKDAIEMQMGVYTGEACTAPRDVYTMHCKGARAAPGRVYATESCASPERVSSTAALAGPGRVLTTESCVAPRRVYFTGA
jgi:hypothetical protein